MWPPQPFKCSRASTARALATHAAPRNLPGPNLSEIIFHAPKQYRHSYPCQKDERPPGIAFKSAGYRRVLLYNPRMLGSGELDTSDVEA
ncbi:Ribonucleoside-diphosphate reductase large chain [Venturia inaequalis]|nr:Ribonucleoside-diphosphate reductase large chain [Venturia inaequalis]